MKCKAFLRIFCLIFSLIFRGNQKVLVFSSGVWYNEVVKMAHKTERRSIMKRTVKALLAMALIAAMLFALVACGGSKSDIVGTWKLSSMEEDGDAVDLDSLEELGLTCTLKVKSDGTAVLDLFGDTTDLKWEDGKMWAAGEEDFTVSYKLSGNKLILEEGGEKLVFKK